MRIKTVLNTLRSLSEKSASEGATIEHFKAWLLRSRLLTRDGTEDGERLIVLCRADLVAAMDPALVAASETTTDGATFHFLLDPQVASADYAAHAPRGAPSRRALPWGQR